MGLDAVVIGALASVAISVIVVAVIAYKIIKNMGDDKTEE
jgi:hypothetical protein